MEKWTRREAIEHVLDMSKAVEVEFGVEAEDTHAALRALGVSEAEIVEART